MIWTLFGLRGALFLGTLGETQHTWETDFYTPPVLGGAALFHKIQRCIKILCPKDPEFYTPLALNCEKGSTSQHWRCIKILGGRFGYFLFFSAWGRGRGSMGRQGGGGRRVKQAQCGNRAHFGHFEGFLEFLATIVRKPCLCSKFQ